MHCPGNVSSELVTGGILEVIESSLYLRKASLPPGHPDQAVVGSEILPGRGRLSRTWKKKNSLVSLGGD